MNSELYDKTYKIPVEVLSFIQKAIMRHPSGEGVKRAKYLLNNKKTTYQNLKRLKNFFKTFDPQKQSQSQYDLAGGDMMRDFVEQTLERDRDGVKKSKEIKRDFTVDHNLGIMPQKTPRLNEGVETEKKSALGVVINSDKKILLLKRAVVKNGWGNGKWSLVGGGVEPNESPKSAVKREIREECGVEVDDTIEKFKIERDGGNEYVFLCKYSGEDDEIKLNDENTSYGWFDYSEIKYLDNVPNLTNYISICIKDYK
jgi:8-oxo-dGTP diphosphatase